jgi:pyruvate/2-oxoglutarate dehydrogenase complex dihydrolipoamide dehydrogenase (E3) component
MTTLVRRPRTLAFDSMERRDLMAPLVVVGGGLINVDVRNVLNNLTVDVNVTDNTVNIIRNSVVIVDIL